MSGKSDIKNLLITKVNMQITKKNMLISTLYWIVVGVATLLFSWSFLTFIIMCTIIFLMIWGNSINIQKKQVEQNSRFQEIAWENSAGLEMFFEYKNSAGAKSKRKIRLYKIIRYLKEYREIIENEEKDISETEDEILKLDKTDPNYRIDKLEKSDWIKEARKQLKETIKDRGDFFSEVYLLGFCHLKNEDRCFKLESISEFYDSDGNKISKGDIFDPLGIAGIIKQELREYNKKNYPIIMWNSYGGLQYTIKYIDEYDESGESDFVDYCMTTKENTYNVSIIEIRSATEKSYKSVCIVGKSKNKEKIMDLRNIISFTDNVGNAQTVYDFLMFVGLDKLAAKNKDK